MKKKLNLNNQDITFNYFEEGKCWRADVLISDEKIEIEIDSKFHNEEKIDWDHFELFFRFISKANRLKDYVALTKKLTLNLAQTIFRNNIGIKDWEVSFTNSMYYNGKIDANFSFSLIYRYFHPTEGFGDDYGIYLAEFESNNLKGIQRWQY